MFAVGFQCEQAPYCCVSLQKSPRAHSQWPVGPVIIFGDYNPPRARGIRRASLALF